MFTDVPNISLAIRRGFYSYSILTYFFGEYLGARYRNFRDRIEIQIAIS